MPVEKLVRTIGVPEGLCLVNAMHITATVFINDADDVLLHDYEMWRIGWPLGKRFHVTITIALARIMPTPT